MSESNCWAATMASQWKGVWDRKGREARESGEADLIALIKADGFDTGAGDHSLDSWAEMTSSVYDKLELGRGMRVFEVGCGSGAFLFPAYQAGIAVAGLDYSEALVEVASLAMPAGDFAHGEACSLFPESGIYDAVLSHSVFQYFDSSEYAEQCVEEMLRIINPHTGCLAVLDINDAERTDDFKRIREAEIGAQAYAEKYRDFPHRFYHKDWFIQLLESRGCRVEVHDQQLESYANAAFRFNVFAWPGKV